MDSLRCVDCKYCRRDTQTTAVEYRCGVSGKETYSFILAYSANCPLERVYNLTV